MRRVEETLRASRYRVTIRSRAGNTENWRVFRTLREVSMIMRAMVMLRAIRMSRTISGTGMTSIKTMPTTPVMMMRSLCRRRRREVVDPVFSAANGRTPSPKVEDEGEDLGDGLVEVGGNFMAYFNGTVDGLGERSVFDYGDAVLDGDIADSLGD